MDQRPQHKSSHTEPHGKESETSLESVGIGDHIQNLILVAQTLRRTINKWELLKLRSFFKAKDTVTNQNGQPTECEKIFTNPTLDSGLVSKIYK